MKLGLYKTIIVISLLLSNPARAEEAPAPVHFYGRYDFAWNGIPLGRLALGIDENDGSYKLHLIVASAGVVNFFTRHASDTVATGRKDRITYKPRYYESYYKTKKKPRHIKLEFDGAGAIRTEINEPPEDRNDRPEVPHNLKDGAYDPLSALLVLRSGNHEFRAFDAKRLYTVRATDCHEGKTYVINKWIPSFSCVLSRVPLAGLTRKEMKEYAEGEPPLTLYFSNDSRRIPLGVSMPVMFGRVRGALVQECSNWQNCAIPVDAK